MHTKFTVKIDSFNKINKIQNAWVKEDYHALLAIMDFDDDLANMDYAELREMCMMSLNDLEPDEAAKVVLTHLFPGESVGKIEQLSHDMPDDRLWEEYPDCLYHQRLFNAYALLREVFNGIFTQPIGVELTITVTAKNPDDMAIFDESLHPSIVRLFASGQGDDALINRLYEEQIQGKQFPEASGILWQLKQLADSGTTRKFTLISSYFWFANFMQVDEFTAFSHADVVDEDE